MIDDSKSNKHISIHSRQSVPKGDFVIYQGDKGDKAFLIQSGKVRVFAEHDGKTHELATLGPGEIFGEMALVQDETRAASVQALETTNLVIITRPMMIEKLAKTDVTIKALMQMLMARLRSGNDAAFSRSATIDGLIDNIETAYNRLNDTLQGPQKKSLEKAAAQKKEDLITALRNFQKSYGDN